MVNWLNGDLQKKFVASREKPWTLGYQSFDRDAVDSGPLVIEGKLPAGLRGVLYRNGPARHERGSGRYAHKWDGDGMVQAFTFDEAGVSHRARYVQTKKFQRETLAGQFELSAYGSAIAGLDELNTDIDEMNAANISVCFHAGELLALWEPGSAHALDSCSLETLGLKTWEGATSLRPFSAHPKRDLQGRLWNFGCDPIRGHLHVYCISPQGDVECSRRFEIAGLPPVHDFAITRNHLIFVLSPLAMRTERLRSGRPFGASVVWLGAQATRVLLIDKRSWAMSWYEIPPCILSHIGNAFEDVKGVIRFDCVCAREPRWMLHGWSLMRGEYDHVEGAVLTLVELKQNGSATTTVLYALESEFPVVDPSAVGESHGEVLCISRSPDRASDLPGWDRLTRFDLLKRTADCFAFGSDWMIEEHVYARDVRSPNTKSGWVVGTALDLQAGKTSVSVFDASSISAGPVARAVLPYAVPLGLHGVFVAAS